MPDRVVVALDQRDRVAARGGVERDAGAGDAAADHDDVEAVARRSPRARRRAASISRGSVDRPASARRALGRRAAPGPAGRGGAGRRSARRPGRPTAARPSGGAQDLRGAPVAGEPAAVGGEQDDVGGDGGGVQVLLVLDLGSPVERAGADDEGRGAVELRPPPRARRPP